LGEEVWKKKKKMGGNRIRDNTRPLNDGKKGAKKPPFKGLERPAVVKKWCTNHFPPRGVCPAKNSERRRDVLMGSSGNK